MDYDQYLSLTDVELDEPKISVADLPGPDRTLLYGYDTARNTWHVYIKNGEIHRVISMMGGPIGHLSRVEWNPADLVPNKRVYPERTDYEFARLCNQTDNPVCFTRYKPLPEGYPQGPFHGLVV